MKSSAETDSTGLARKVAKLERHIEKVERHAEKLERHIEKIERQSGKRLSFLPWLIGLTGLRSEHTVLDVGCGPGRATRDLVPYLAHRGAYHGIEVQLRFVERLREQYRCLPGFQFHHADLWNSTYNPCGMERAGTYRFPVEDEQVDVALVRSVFTHLVPEELDNYMAELARVVRPGGRAYASWFILDDVSRRAVARGPSEPPHPLFRVSHGDYWVKADENPAHAVAVEERYLRDLYDRHGWCLLEPLHHGQWSGLRDGLRRQDVVIAERLGG